MWSKAFPLAAVAFLGAGLLPAQDQPLPQNAVTINLPDNSPLAFLSSTYSDSRATARGAAMVLDLHMSLTLRNTTPNRIHGVTLRVVTQEATLGGKGSVTYPSLNVGPGEALPVRIDMQLLRPSQAIGGPLVQVDLDGVLFQDLSFFGPDRLNSRRTLTACELEARRDREHFKRVLAQGGVEALAREMRDSLARQAEAGQLAVAVSRAGRAVTTAAIPEHTEEFAFLQFPDSPVEPLKGSAVLSGNEARAPRIEVRNRANRAVKYVEMGWIVSDSSGHRYMAGSLPSADRDMTLAPGQTVPVLQDTTLSFTAKGRPIQLQRMIGFVNQVEFSDGRIWVPNRDSLANTSLLSVLPPSPEEQRLSDLYRRKGVAALITELSKY
ncbi:MAG: hypothetical protein JST11_07575 [Acidobacteria bacterium]|nr:hypothetical protein [Acidobacteriota bacterium]